MTDYLLALLAGVLGYWLWRGSRRAAEARRVESSAWLGWWSVAYAASAVSGVSGGTVHAFHHALGPDLLAALWMVTLQSLVLAGFAVVSAIVAISGVNRRAARWVAGVAFGAWALWTLTHPAFLSALAAYSAALLLLAAFALRDPRSAGSRFLLAGVLASAAAGVVQRTQLSPHPQFDHDDLFHVVQGVAVWLLFQGAMRR